jgi:multicomponent Na+:H+ antiporter subunit B
MTEAAVGDGVSTILLLAPLLLTDYKEKKSKPNLLPLIVISITGAALIYATIGMPDFGDPLAPANLHLAPHYIKESMNEIGIPNIVTSILASYRGFDTLGETFVVFTAGISVILLLGKNPKNKKI